MTEHTSGEADAKTETEQTDKTLEKLPDELEGMIKFYKADEGYGFLSDGSQDYYFNLHAIKGTEMPSPGDKVYYKLSKRRPPKGKNPQAASVRVTVKAADIGRRKDERLECPHCHRKVTPRLVLDRGCPSYSLCPYCGKIVKDFRKPSDCFIATAVYEDRLAPEVIALRRFRDEVLQPHAAGRAFIKFYYRYGPGLAQRVKHAAAIKKLLRLLLVALARRFEYTSAKV